MSSYYMTNGNTVTATSSQNVQIDTVLAPATYAVKFNSMNGQFYLEVIENYTFSGHVYGDALTVRDRIIRTYNERTKNTGVLLSGAKGSGKTLLSKLLSISLMEQGIPTLVINTPFAGEAFNTFIASISQDVVVIFDEFEKVYNDDDAQNGLLTLFDGTYAGHKLFIITTNDNNNIVGPMVNRPGRFYYRLSYKGVDSAFIRDYCQRNLSADNMGKVEQIVGLAAAFYEFNFDMLMALVEEINRYGETPMDAIKFLNITLDVFSARKDSYDVKSFEWTREGMAAYGSEYVSCKAFNRGKRCSPFSEKTDMFLLEKKGRKANQKSTRVDSYDTYFDVAPEYVTRNEDGTLTVRHPYATISLAVAANAIGGGDFYDE